MTLRTISLILLLIGTTWSIIAQEIKGTVIDQEGNAIPYVNIYNDQLNAGMISNFEGFFTIDIAKFNATNTFTFSCIGFEEKRIALSELKKDIDSLEIQLSPTSYSLTEVEIKAKAIQYKKKKVGIKAKIPMIEQGFYINSEEIGDEFGVVIKHNKNCTIEKIGMNVTEVSHDTMFYEINIYDFKNNKPQQPIIQKRIFLSFLKSDINRPIEIDLSDRNIKVSSNFFVSLEAIRIPPNCEEYGTSFVGSFKGKKTLRKNSKGKWEKNGIGVAIYTQLKCAR